ncbi:MAG TPA: hypothetical protein ENO20_11490 [Bacteroides sp.]|nr:hypothetical protein [Bacteroides sp.]
MTKNVKWADELALVKKIIEKTGLTRTTKWDADVYTWNGKNIVSCGGFKDYFALWFYDGVFLKDTRKMLVNAQTGKTKALRQWRFASADEIDETLILDYINEAIQNAQEGKTWAPQKGDPLEIPETLERALRNDQKLKNAFGNLTEYKQKEYAEYIESARREETKQSRLEKIIPMILNGIGLNDRYKKNPLPDDHKKQGRKR